MWSRPARAFFLGLSALAVLTGVRADQTITVDGQDTSIKYTTVDTSSTNATWLLLQRSSDSCDTPQKLTSRIGDYMTYTFTGTGIYVIGTVGVKQGIINFTLDGQNITNFDRGRSQLICDFVLFQSLDLPYQQHTIVATLVGQGLNLQSGLEDGVLSIQRLRYVVPGGGSSTSIGPIIGGVVGAVVLIGACGAGWFFWRRHRHPVKRRNNAAFWDNDDDGGAGGGGKHATMVATPFEWDGPQPHQQQGQGHYGGAEGEQPPGSPSLAASQPLLASGQSPPWSASAHTTSFAGLAHNSGSSNSTPGTGMTLVGAGPRTHTSSSSGERRRAAAAAGLVAANPDPGRGEKNPSAYAMEALNRPGGSQQHLGPGQQRPQQVDDTQLVDRIAQRLADIMTERVGVVGGDAPPSYVGDDRDAYGSPPPPAAHDGPSTSTSYPPAPAPAPAPAPPAVSPINPAKSPSQYAQSPPPSAGLQPPVTPPSTSTSFAPGTGGSRFGPRPRPSGSVSGGWPTSAGSAVQRGSSISKDAQGLRRDSLSPSAPGY